MKNAQREAAKATKAAMLARIDDRMRALLGGAATVQDAAQALASDPDGLAWSNTGYIDGDTRSTLARVTMLPVDEVLALRASIVVERNRRGAAAYYAEVTRRDNAEALARRPRSAWIPDQFED